MINYKKGDTVEVTKAGTFNGAVGKIIGIKANIDFGSSGIWAIDFDDLKIPGNAKPIEPDKAFNEIVKQNTPKAPVKKVKSDKPKRKYIRKDK